MIFFVLLPLFNIFRLKLIASIMPNHLDIKNVDNKNISSFTPIELLILKQRFREADTDGDGLLSANEVFSVLKASNPDLTQDKIFREFYEFMDKADFDRNGAINFVDWLKYISVHEQD